MNDGEYIPLLLQGDTEENLQKLFDGPIPKVGDRVEYVCYAATEKSVYLKWRVVPTIEALTKRV